MQTAYQLLKNVLEEDGWDGLSNPGICGCGLNDLAPCGEMSPHCCPARGSWEDGFFYVHDEDGLFYTHDYDLQEEDQA